MTNYHKGDGMKKYLEERKIARRCTIDLTPAADAELKRICDAFRLSNADCFRCGPLFLRIYTDARRAGKNVFLQKPGSGDREIVELPLFLEE
jgi:hypothetical protein